MTNPFQSLAQSYRIYAQDRHEQEKKISDTERKRRIAERDRRVKAAQEKQELNKPFELGGAL